MGLMYAHGRREADMTKLGVVEPRVKSFHAFPRRSYAFVFIYV